MCRNSCALFDFVHVTIVSRASVGASKALELSHWLAVCALKTLDRLPANVGACEQASPFSALELEIHMCARWFLLPVNV